MGLKQGKPPKGATHGIVDQLLGLAVPLEAVELDPDNARAHDQRNLDAIVLSLREHGQRVPIVVQAQGSRVRAGNGRVLAAQRMGWTHLAAVVVDESDADAVAYAIRDNRTAELATWDLRGLGEQLRYLSGEGYDLADIGWTPYEAEPLLVAEWRPSEPTEGAAFALPDKRVSLMFTREQWEELGDLLAAKPTADEVLDRLREAREAAE